MRILPILDITGSFLNPAGSRDNLSALKPPASVPGNLMQAPKFAEFLSDVYDLKLRLRCCVFEVVGVCHMRPHLHSIESRTPGIIFEAHMLISKHRTINEVFMTGGKSGDWVMQNVQALDERFALGLQSVLAYAQDYEGDYTQYARSFIHSVMREYGEYFSGQTDEWFSNPAKRLAGIGAHTGGPQHAHYLHSLGQAGIRSPSSSLHRLWARLEFALLLPLSIVSPLSHSLMCDL